MKEETTTRANTSDSVSAILPFLEVLREAILLVSKDREILAANRAATEILGLSVEQLNGRGPHPPIAFITQHKDGSWRYLEHRINNMLDDPAVGE